tara:strand:- start:4505 stop:4753 length:249 start_codon:yes stop_codon:yes gene_type:complete
MTSKNYIIYRPLPKNLLPENTTQLQKLQDGFEKTLPAYLVNYYDGVGVDYRRQMIEHFFLEVPFKIWRRYRQTKQAQRFKQA